jgi:hypothetical protein
VEETSSPSVALDRLEPDHVASWDEDWSAVNSCEDSVIASCIEDAAEFFGDSVIASNVEVTVSSTDSVVSSDERLVSCGVVIVTDDKTVEVSAAVSDSVVSEVSSHDVLVSWDDETWVTCDEDVTWGSDIQVAVLSSGAVVSSDDELVS